MIMAEKSSIGFSGFAKLTFFGRNFEIFQNFENFENFQGRRSCSTSYPSGNQVDGSPLVANTKTIAKRARVGPRTPVLSTVIMLF